MTPSAPAWSLWPLLVRQSLALPSSQPLKRLNSIEHDSDRLTCGEPARAEYRRNQHTDSRSFNDTHHDSEICRRQPLASWTRPAELNRPRSCSHLESLSSSNLLKTSASGLTTPSGRRGGDTTRVEAGGLANLRRGVWSVADPISCANTTLPICKKTKRAQGAPSHSLLGFAGNATRPVSAAREIEIGALSPTQPVNLFAGLHAKVDFLCQFRIRVCDSGSLDPTE